MSAPGGGGPDTLRLATRPQPTPDPGEVLVRVWASGVNRADLLQRMGRYPAPEGAPSDVPGLEIAGEVADVAPGMRAWSVGDRVMGLVGGGGYAEYVAVPADHLLRIPEDWSFEQAAAVPEAFMTGFDALAQARLAAGDRVLIHAVGSGVGAALLQLARDAGATVAGTSRTEAKLRRAAAELGLEHPVLVRDGVFEPLPWLRHWADVVCDLVGGPYLPGNLAAAALRGRIVVIGLTGGRSAAIDLGTLLAKRVTLVGTVLRSRTREEKAELTRAFAKRVLPALEAGRLRPIVDKVVPAADAAAAHRYMEANSNFGAVVLVWGAGRE